MLEIDEVDMHPSLSGGNFEVGVDAESKAWVEMMVNDWMREDPGILWDILSSGHRAEFCIGWHSVGEADIVLEWDEPIIKAFLVVQFGTTREVGRGWRLGGGICRDWWKYTGSPRGTTNRWMHLLCFKSPSWGEDGIVWSYLWFLIEGWSPWWRLFQQVTELLFWYRLWLSSWSRRSSLSELVCDQRQKRCTSWRIGKGSGTGWRAKRPAARMIKSWRIHWVWTGWCCRRSTTCKGLLPRQ